MSSRGNLIILSAPSGSGKTSLANLLLEEVTELDFSVSHTTRARRRGEQHGVEYFFVSVAVFEEMIRQDAFLEYEHVYGNYYGTSRAFVEDRLAQRRDVLLDIDVKGALNVRRQLPQAILVFVLPPSYQVLSERLQRRGLDDPEIIERRLKVARAEIGYFRKYDYVIINQDIGQSVSQLRQIVLAARNRVERCLDEAESIRDTFPRTGQE